MGFIVSAIISPLIAFIIGLFLRKDIRALEEKKIKKGEAKRCPYCYELIRPEAKVCKHCGKELRT